MSEHGAAPAELLVLLQSSLERPRAQSRASSPPCMFLMSRCSMTSGAGARSSRCGFTDLLLESGHAEKFS